VPLNVQHQTHQSQEQALLTKLDSTSLHSTTAKKKKQP